MDPAEQIDDLPRGGLLYEPRSLWSVLPVTLQDTDQEVAFPRAHFYNGGKYPITVERIALHGINYEFAVQDEGMNLGAPYASSGAVVNSVQLRIGVPFRRYFSRQPIVIDGFGAEPTGQPGPRGVTGPLPHIPSSIWGLSKLDLSERPLYLPQRGSIEIGFSSVRRPSGFGFDDPPRGYAVWQQEGGLFAGASRSFTWEILGQAATADQIADPVGSVGSEGWPYALNVFQEAYIPAPQTREFWPSSAHFSAKDFDDQEPTRGGTSKITALRVMLDQRQIDLACVDALGLGASPARMEMLAGRMGTRVRTVNGGTKEYWWRPGAPLSLVADTITPATVVKLESPITLSPEDSLEVRAIVPGVQGLPEELFLRTMNIGVALNGFATIEG